MRRGVAQNITRALPLTVVALLLRRAESAEPAPAVRPSTAQENVQVLPHRFVIPGLNRERTVRLYLPPAYGRSHRRYPVMYMHDGQNLFDDASAYAGEWGIEESLTPWRSRAAWS